MVAFVNWSSIAAPNDLQTNVLSGRKFAGQSKESISPGRLSLKDVQIAIPPAGTSCLMWYRSKTSLQKTSRLTHPLFEV